MSRLAITEEAELDDREKIYINHKIVRILLVAREFTHDPYIGEVVDKLDVTPNYVSKKLTEFEELGYIEKYQDEDHKRKTRIRLTDEGKLIADGFWKIYSVMYDEPVILA